MPFNPADFCGKSLLSVIYTYYILFLFLDKGMLTTVNKATRQDFCGGALVTNFSRPKNIAISTIINKKYLAEPGA